MVWLLFLCFLDLGLTLLDVGVVRCDLCVLQLVYLPSDQSVVFDPGSYGAWETINLYL